MDGLRDLQGGQQADGQRGVDPDAGQGEAHDMTTLA